MPYSPKNKADVGKVKEKLLKTYKSVSDTAARQAIHVFNSVMDSSGDEGRAWASVYSKMNDRLTKKGRSEKIHLAAALPKGSPERRAILSALRYELHVSRSGRELQLYVTNPRSGMSEGDFYTPDTPGREKRLQAMAARAGLRLDLDEIEQAIEIA